MIRLIKNEIFKIFHKTSTYIVLVIALLFVILTNVIYLYYDDNVGSYEYTDVDIATVNDYINNYDPTVDSLDDYAYNLALLDSYNLSQNYEHDSWQYSIFMNEYLAINTEYYRLLHSEDAKEEEIAELNDTMLLMLQAIYQDDWQYFASEEKKNLEAQIAEYEELLEASNLSNDTKLEYYKELNVLEEKLWLVEYRLDENVAYGNDYLNEAISNIESNLYALAEYRYNYEASREDYEGVLKTYYESKYVLEEKVDTNNSSTLRSIIMNFFDEYSFLIIVFVIMLAGGIVSDEFSKGTIKALLTVPHSRGKILTAKYITIILSIPFIVLLLLVFEFIVGGVLLGFDSLSIPAVVYNISTNAVDVLNVFSYFGLMFLANLPQLILLATLAFACSTILNSTAFAIAITFCGMIAAQIINSFAYAYDIGILDYFVTTNWDFTTYLFGGSSMFGLSVGHSLMVCFTYLVLMLLVTYMVFINKDIKNV